MNEQYKKFWPSGNLNFKSLIAFCSLFSLLQAGQLDLKHLTLSKNIALHYLKIFGKIWVTITPLMRWDKKSNSCIKETLKMSLINHFTSNSMLGSVYEAVGMTLRVWFHALGQESH